MGDKKSDKMCLHDQSIQATLLLAIYGRAKASRMFPNILCDQEAIQIVDEMDYDFSDIDKSYGTEFGCLSCLVRAKRLDDRCLDYIAKHPKGSVINLGSGLDTTFSRVDNGIIRWYNVDMPDAMALRYQFIPPTERVTNISKSMFDYTWLDDVEDTVGEVFILAGGLFYYFEREQIEELLQRMTERFSCGEIFFDAQSQSAIKMSNKKIRKTGNNGSEMKFYLNDAQILKTWLPRIQLVQSVDFFGDTRQLKGFKVPTKLNMWAIDTFKMGQLVSIKW